MNNTLINQTFAKGPAFLAYITAGDGGLDYSLEAALALIKGGVDILEIGVPFSDPVADGPVIQRAMQRALNNETTLFDALNLAQKIKQHTNIPIVLFSYYNPILAVMKSNFFELAQQSKIDAILIVDLPLEEAADHEKNCKLAHIDPIFIITPVTSQPRLLTIDQHSSAFLYYACQKGTTGIRNSLPAGIAENLTTIKKVVKHPVVAGFGISNRESAKTVLNYADGFVVGSAIVQAMEQKATPEQLTQLVKDIDPR